VALPPPDEMYLHTLFLITCPISFFPRRFLFPQLTSSPPSFLLLQIRQIRPVLWFPNGIFYKVECPGFPTLIGGPIDPRTFFPGHDPPPPQDQTPRHPPQSSTGRMLRDDSLKRKLALVPLLTVLIPKRELLPKYITSSQVPPLNVPIPNPFGPPA